jgi:hypothetical protein
MAETKKIEEVVYEYDECPHHQTKKYNLFAPATKSQGCDQCMEEQNIKEKDRLDAGRMAKAKLDIWNKLKEDLETTIKICEEVPKKETLFKLYREA